MKKLRILLIDTNQKIFNYLNAQFNEEFCEFHFSSVGKEGLLKAFEIRPHIFIFDGEMIKDIEMDALLQRIKKNPRFQNSLLISFSKNIALFSEENFPFDFVFPKTNAGLKELVDQISKYLPKNHSNSFVVPQTTKLTIAKSIVFVSPKGGTGLSTICANVGSFMYSLNNDDSVALMSLSEPHDSFPIIMGSDDNLSILTLNEMKSSELTPFFLKKNMKQVPNWNVYLLSGFSKHEQNTKVSNEKFQKIMHAFRYAFDYILIDLGTEIRSAHTKLLTSADIVVVVIQPDPLCVAHTKKLVEHLKLLGVRQQQLMGVFNHINDVKGFVTSQIENEVDLSIRHSIPNFGQLLVDTYSPRPIYLRARNEYLTMAFRQVALELQNKAKESYQNRLKTTY